LPCLSVSPKFVSLFQPAVLLTGGQVADCTAADALLDQMLAAVILNGENRYDSDAVRRKIESMGATPEHSTEGQPTLEEQLLAIPRPQRHRVYVRPLQRFFAESQLDTTPRPPPSRRRLSSLSFAIGYESGP
jgi:hypothetical protein